MTTRYCRLFLMAAVAVLVSTRSLEAQFPSEIVGFNGLPVDDVDNSHEMFREPEWSGTTVEFIVLNTVGLFDENVAFRATPLVMEGLASLEVLFKWVDASDTDAWVRLTTANGALRPNPALDTGGLVRFDLTNKGEIFNGDIGLCLGIRETDLDVPQLADGGLVGPIEWVGVSTALSIIECGTNGCATAPANDDIMVNTIGLAPNFTPINFIVAGPDGTLDTTTNGDDTAFFGYSRPTESNAGGLFPRRPIPAITLPTSATPVSLEWDLATGKVFVNAADMGGGITGFTGDGTLSTPNNRGTLEHLAITNVPTDTATQMDFAIDELQFEATVEDPTPTPTVVAPILRAATQVTVTNLDTNATTVIELWKNGSELTDLTTNGDVVAVDTFVFDLPAPAVPGDVYTARQKVDGVYSIFSNPVTVTFPGPVIGLLPKEGDTTVRVTGIDPEATEVELFVNDVFRGSVTTNGSPTLPFTVTVPTGAALEMGEEVIAIQIVTGGTSDDSPIAIVTTDSITEVFCDDFEYADQTAFDGVWVAHTGDTQLVLSDARNATVNPLAGGKSAYSDNTGVSTAANQSQLIAEFGGTVGTDTHPIIFNVSYFDGLEAGALYRQQAELRASGLASPILALGKTNSILGNFHSARLVGGPGWINLNDFGQPQRTNGWHVLTAAIKASTVDIYVDGTLAELNVSFTASAALATALIGSGLSSAGGEAYYDDLCVETGALHFNTITTQPPEAPTIEAPIVPLATSVTVLDLDTNSTEASLYLNAGATPISTLGLVDQTSVVFTIASAVSNDVYTATQTALGLESLESDPVTVLLPPPTLYKAPADGETNGVRVVNVDTNASVVRVKVDGTERGTIAPNNASDVVVPLPGWTLRKGEVVTANMTVNAILSIDSDPDTVTTNAVQSTIWCDDFESYANQGAFEGAYPLPVTTQLELSTDRNATTGGMQSMSAPAASPTHRSRSPVQTGVAGTDLQPVVWSINIFDETAGTGVNQYADLNNLDSDFYLTEIGIAAPEFTGLGQPETHYQARLVGNGAPLGTNNGWFHLDQFNAPTRSIGWHTFTVVFKGPPPSEATGHEVDFYVDGALAFKNRVIAGDTVLRRARIGSGQTSTAAAFFDDYCAEVGPVTFPTIAPQPPNKPTLVAPLEKGDTTVTLDNVGPLNDVDPDVTTVGVYANGSPIGSFVDLAGTNGTVVVTVTPLVHLDAITADQENAAGTSLASDPLEVGQGNGVVTVCIGIRETGDAGALGSTGGTTGAIEWISASSESSGAPQGEALSPSSEWRHFVFDPPPGDPVTAFPGSGNGTINGSRGTLEHLAVSVNSTSPDRSTGAYTMYVDNVINVGADAGNDFIIADFEANSNGDEVLFQEPTFSGSTFPADLTPLPSASEVSSAQAKGGERSAVLRWFWKDTTAERWVRITTSGTDFVSQPIIDITKPVSMDILLLAECMTVVGDADGDGDFDVDDFGEIVACLDGPAIGYDTGCACADMNGDLKVDLADYAGLQDLLVP